MKIPLNKQGVTLKATYTSPNVVVFGHIATVTQQNMSGAITDGSTMMNMTIMGTVAS